MQACRLAPLASVAIALFAAGEASAQGWSRFRGPNGSGVSETAGLPTEFGPEQNVIWRSVVAFGRSSPVLAGDNVYLTGADEQGLVVLCLDRRTGEVRWQR